MTVLRALGGAATGLLAYKLLVPHADVRTRAVAPADERVLLLGASTGDGLGAGFLEQYLERGTKQLIIVGRRKEALEKVREDVLARTASRRAPDAQVSVFAADCTRTADVVALREFVLAQFGGIDTLHIIFGLTSILPLLGCADVDPLNVNADGAPSASLYATAEGLDNIAATVQRSSDGNLKGSAIVLGALIPALQTTSAYPVVVTTGSVAGLIPAPTRSVYCATKASQHYLVNSVALECQSQAGTLVPGTDTRRALVRFLLLAPGPIKNSFVATHSVDATTGPRDNRSNALQVADIVRDTLRRVDKADFGMLVLPKYAFFAFLLTLFQATRAVVANHAHKLYRY
ncbi:hypothetical protein MSPP1_003942 [Malassezia sp. CBS 17886]|nr:hypothetical protein MSPP1_003942 [Malassezia sp. CBS 17886]